LEKKPGEKIHWVVFEPAYTNRWYDDSDITFWERMSWIAGTNKKDKSFTDSRLDRHRKKAADFVVSKRGAKNYLHRIQQIAKKHKIQYHGIKTPAGFWKVLASMTDNSISRVWFSGHAAPDNLFLSLSHSTDGKLLPQAISGQFIDIVDVHAHGYLATKFKKGTSTVSEFYGCYTKSFAQKWNAVFSVPTAGALNSITFKVIGSTTSGKNVLEALRTTPATVSSPVDWTTFP